MAGLAVQPHYRCGSRADSGLEFAFSLKPLVLRLLFNRWAPHVGTRLEGSCARPKVPAQGHSPATSRPLEKRRPRPKDTRLERQYEEAKRVRQVSCDARDA